MSLPNENYVDHVGRVNNTNYDFYSPRLGNDIAAEYSNKAYNVGDYCIFRGQLYRCTTAIPSGEGTTLVEAHWTPVKTTDEISGLKSVFTYLNNESEVDFDLLNNFITSRTPEGIIQSLSNPTQGTVVEGYAWRITKNTVQGNAYKYADYSFPSSYGYQFFIVTGHSWSNVYPLISFYDANNNLLYFYGQEGDTQFTKIVISIPKDAVRCVVNGRTGQDLEIYGYTRQNLLAILSCCLMPYYHTIDSTVLQKNPTYNYMRNWPNHYSYAISSDIISSILDKPTELSGNATVIKFGIGNKTTKGYTTYLAINNKCMFLGWDNGGAIFWQQIQKTIDYFATKQVYDDYQKVSGSMTSGKARHKNGTSQASGTDYRYTQYSVTPGDELYISGYHYANGYPLFIVFDSNNNVLFTPEYGNTGHCHTEFYTVPNSASYIIVNGLVSKNAGGNGFPDLRKLLKEENLHTSLLKEKKNKRKFLFVGDSYCEGYSHDGNNSGWATYCAQYLGLTSADYVRAYHGGARFSSSSNTYEQRVPLDYPADEFTDVVVCGGYNDNSYTEEQVLTGIQSFVNLIKGKYPYAKIYIGFVAWNKAGDGDGAIDTWQTIHNNLLNTTMPAYQKCTKFGALYMNNVEYWINNSLITHSDGYHPSEAGNRSIGQAVAHALLSGSAPLPHNESYRLN